MVSTDTVRCGRWRRSEIDANASKGMDLYTLGQERMKRAAVQSVLTATPKQEMTGREAKNASGQAMTMERQDRRSGAAAQRKCMRGKVARNGNRAGTRQVPFLQPVHQLAAVREAKAHGQCQRRTEHWVAASCKKKGHASLIGIDLFMFKITPQP